jgi:hypothetical protein
MKSGIRGGVVGLAAFILFFGMVPADLQAQEDGTQIMASRIIDAAVYDEKQQQIGEVDDLILRRSGRVKKLTVEFGGFLDMGDTLVAVSFKRFGLKNGDVTLDATKQQLQKRSEFNYYRHGLRPGYYYRARPYAGPYYYPPPGYYYGPNAQNPPVEPYEWAFSPSRFLASVVMNRRLINEEGKDIGRVKDLLINRKDNKVEKIILFSEEILGEKVYAGLAYEPLGFTALGLVYDISPGKLKDFIYPYKK